MKIEDMKTGYVIEMDSPRLGFRGLVLKESNFSSVPIVLYENGEWDKVSSIEHKITKVYDPENGHDINPINIGNVNLDDYLIPTRGLMFKCGDYVRYKRGMSVYVISATGGVDEKSRDTQYNVINLYNGWRFYEHSMNMEILEIGLKQDFEIITADEMMYYLKNQNQ